MFDKFIDTEYVDCLQSNISSIRFLFGWTPRLFSDKMDISYDMMSRISSGARKMTYVEYLAILRLAEDEIKSLYMGKAAEEAFECMLTIYNVQPQYLVDNFLLKNKGE